MSSSLLADGRGEDAEILVLGAIFQLYCDAVCEVIIYWYPG
jgi:hypothetical protein